MARESLVRISKSVERLRLVSNDDLAGIEDGLERVADDLDEALAYLGILNITP